MAGHREQVGGDDDAPDVAVGDNARGTFQSSESFDPGEESSILSFNFVGSAGSQGTVTGLAGVPEALAAHWLNLKGGSGLYGDQDGEWIFFDNGTTALGVTIRWGTNLTSGSPGSASRRRDSTISPRRPHHLPNPQETTAIASSRVSA